MIRSVRVLAGVLLAGSLLSACASGPVPKRERLHVELRYTDKPRQLAMSMYASPFFRDASRRLLSAEHPDEVELLVTPRGDTIHPGEPLEVLPAGTPVRVLRVLFPSAFGAVGRPLLTPSDRVWVELAIEGRPESPTWVLVLSPDLESEKAVVAEVERFLTTESLDQEIAAMSEVDRTAIATKTITRGVGTRALELAFRKPNLRRIHRDEEYVMEEWIWNGPGEQLVAHVRNGVVQSTETKPMPAAASSASGSASSSESPSSTGSLESDPSEL